jgi:hypothetical protein
MNTSLRKLILIAGGVIVVVCAASVAFLYLRNKNQAAAVIAYAPPVVLITSPEDGSEVPTGSILAISATAQSADPIIRAELWGDGQLLATQDPDNPNGDSILYAYFPLRILEGQHMLLVRATNSMGVVGQSLPISVIGLPLTENGGNPPADVNVNDQAQLQAGRCPIPTKAARRHRQVKQAVAGMGLPVAEEQPEVVARRAAELDQKAVERILS